MQNKTGEMKNAQWLAIHTDLPVSIMEQLFTSRKLSQKQLSDFWKAFKQVRDYIN